MIYKGSLTQCVLACATAFKYHSNCLLGIVNNPRAKYYTVEDDKSLDNYDLAHRHRHLRLVFFGTRRELLTFATAMIEPDFFTENQPEGQENRCQQSNPQIDFVDESQTEGQENQCPSSEDSGNQVTQ